MVKSKSSLVYKKLLPSGLTDKNNLTQGDYDNLVQYIKTSFPKATSMQRDIEQTLKRTFVFNTSSSKKFNRSFAIEKRARNNRSEEQKKSRRLKVSEIPRHISYNKFCGLHTLWKEYISELIGETDKIEDIQQRLNKADLHGADILVTHSNCKDFIGLQGIVIKETKNTFVIVSPQNVTKTIPKPEGEFKIKIGELHGSIVLAGNSFLTRPAERASKKIKSFMEFVSPKVYKSTLRYTKH